MILQSIHLINFRNMVDRLFDFDPSLTIIIGENAQGKTNLLESIYLTVHGTGFRESKEDELVRWGETKAFVSSIWSSEKDTYQFTVAFTVRGEKVEKQYLVNKTKKTHVGYNEYQNGAVLFAPEHIDIVTGPPEKRRDYFNRVLFYFDKEYKKHVQNYEHALYRRNKVLETAHDSTIKEELLFWDGYLENHAKYITAKRQEYCDYLNAHRDIEDKKFRIEYVKNELTQERLTSMFQEERRMRRTLIGPQKDDFQIYLDDGKDDENVHHFGSRSEQRLGVFWLKLNEITYIEEVLHVKPLLLLDDVFSELDTKNKKLILDVMGDYQTILTTTESELLELTSKTKTVIRI